MPQENLYGLPEGILPLEVWERAVFPYLEPTGKTEDCVDTFLNAHFSELPEFAKEHHRALRNVLMILRNTGIDEEKWVRGILHALYFEHDKRRYYGIDHLNQISPHPPSWNTLLILFMHTDDFSLIDPCIRDQFIEMQRKIQNFVTQKQGNITDAEIDERMKYYLKKKFRKEKSRTPGNDFFYQFMMFAQMNGGNSNPNLTPIQEEMREFRDQVRRLANLPVLPFEGTFYQSIFQFPLVPNLFTEPQITETCCCSLGGIFSQIHIPTSLFRNPAGVIIPSLLPLFSERGRAEIEKSLERAKAHACLPFNKGRKIYHAFLYYLLIASMTILVITTSTHYEQEFRVGVNCNDKMDCTKSWDCGAFQNLSDVSYNNQTYPTSEITCPPAEKHAFFQKPCVSEDALYKKIINGTTFTASCLTPSKIAQALYALFIVSTVISIGMLSYLIPAAHYLCVSLLSVCRGSEADACTKRTHQCHGSFWNNDYSVSPLSSEEYGETGRYGAVARLQSARLLADFFVFASQKRSEEMEEIGRNPLSIV